ncbi:methyltransferase type 12 [Photobacterium proteolyticum]|uniref:Methyltransferase type 12 n=1 Tax=Photobacterium proteolyticum TaxID=1903952 RepID=A0A1Q9GJ87_9GAMM|nr:class I SAM-dependent methyltransferase [Photobacterium proteolyticum]OLQ74536.1 methyltransferase type 12 [Photobacterium proteolyticum]
MDYLAINKEAWDKRTKVHVKSQFYDVNGFLQGKSSLNTIELEEVGSVEGKSLLHLQCHFGLDTLSWARLGAKVTGVDLSSESISQAESIAKQANLEASFICSDVYQFNEVCPEKFDIVFVSYGALCWLPDLNLWAETVSKALKPGGKIHLVEFHPFDELLLGSAYFASDEPIIEDDGTYTENCTGDRAKMVTWMHPVSDVINALVKSGISIECFNEYPYSPYYLEGFVAGESGAYQLLHKGNAIPLVYSVTGKKL